VLPSAPRATIPPSDPRRLILIVDDNTDHVEFLRLALGSRYRVAAAADGLLAYELALREQPDAILLDVMMPIVDGPTLMRKLAANAKTNAIPIVVVTALDADSLGPLPDGVVTLRKPCHQGEILDALEQALAARTPRPDRVPLAE
jgi:CheY-like chemotaxis protein